jgi:hypothetical protein
VLTLSAVFLHPLGDQVRAALQTSSDTVNIFFGNRLQDDAPVLIFEKLDLRAGFDPMLATEFRRHNKLAL